MDQAEAAVIQQAAADLLRNISVRAVTRDLRERGVPTATGAASNTRSLRGVLLKPAVAGLAVGAASWWPRRGPPSSNSTCGRG